MERELARVRQPARRALELDEAVAAELEHLEPGSLQEIAKPRGSVAVEADLAEVGLAQPDPQVAEALAELGREAQVVRQLDLRRSGHDEDAAGGEQAVEVAEGGDLVGL